MIDTFMAQILLMVSLVYTYLQSHQVVYIEYVQLSMLLIPTYIKQLKTQKRPEASQSHTT